MELLKNIFKILDHREKRVLLKLIFLDVAVSILDVFFLAMLLFVIKFYTDPSQSFLPHVFNTYPLLLITLFFLLFGAKNVFAFFVFRIRSGYTYNVATRLSKERLENYFDSTYAEYVNIDSSVHTRRISQEPIEFCYYILGGYQQVVSQSILICITVATILVYNPVLFPLLFAMLTPPVLISGWLQKRKLENIRKNAAAIRRVNFQHLQEALSGFVESNLYQGRNFFLNRYHHSQREFNNFLSTQQVVQNLPSKLIEVFAVFGLFVLILINKSTTDSNSVQLLTLAAFMAAAYKIIPGVVKIVNTLGQMKTYEFTVMDLLKDKPAAPEQNRSASRSINSIEFRNVSFGYNGEPVINDLSFAIRPGDFVGLSAPSGKGKTTIINLLLGFLKPSSGSLLINGEKLDDIERQAYWNKISYIKQQPFFIHDTAIRNVVFTDAVYDEQRFESASNLSGFKTFINGEATKVIRENGKNISGGQRQRIVLTRAMYKDFDILLLDEPFSEMDEEAEVEILQKLRSLSRDGKMILMITHNESSLAFCNKIISINE